MDTDVTALQVLEADEEPEAGLISCTITCPITTS